MKLRDTEEEVALIAESSLDAYAIKRFYESMRPSEPDNTARDNDGLMEEVG